MPSVVTALLSGLRNHGFRASLSKKPPESMTELLRRGEEYIDQEEVLKATCSDRESYENGNKKRQREEPMMSKLSTRFMIEYKYGPRTECRTLQNEVERLVSKGFIKHFVKRHESHHKEASEEVGQKRRAGVINVIAGESTGFSQPITFDDEDLNGVSLPHDDALVITGDIADFDVKRVLVDMGSAANVLSWEAFTALKMPIDRLRPVNTPLQGFGGGTVVPERVIELLVVLGKHPCCVTLITPFLIVRTPMAYNSIYDRPIINTVGAVISTQHQSMKFPTSRGIGVIRRNQLTSKRCYVDSI
ncbi:Uncharacterized protein Adt_21240 [Abeliophyllum distichum]|uniref:Uncharacterized protein n=1 Tax=Abeliophyllum distichum TaxID=126358 RepID=A0ABD1SYV5_9LAMI